MFDEGRKTVGRLDGKIALVTGAGSGIGETTSKLFAKEGATVVLVARREPTLEQVKKAIEAEGGKAIYVAADVSTKEGCEKCVAFAIAQLGRIDILVNNAGIADKHRSTLHTTDEFWHEVLNINQTGVFRMCKETLKHMEKQGSGSIINVSSIGGYYGSAGIAYSASKAAVIGMTKNIAIQYAGKGIRCNSICPGPTPTALNTPDKMVTFDQEMIQITGRHMDTTLPATEPIDQANAILFFAGDESKGITGENLVIDNGMCL
jgi:NAD(P)-dependent dehydrogenase (short-subunit alcohol dehydrogenase family)